MGAYLFYKTQNNPDEVSKFLHEEDSINIKLRELEEHLHITDSEDLAWVQNNRPELLDMESQKFGTGELKTSGGLHFATEKAGFDYEDIAEMWVLVFEELNKRFKMKYYARSCSLDENYFSIAQMKRITQNGTLLSGKSSSKDYVVEKYNELYELLSKPEIEYVDISILKNGDQIQLEDGSWKRIEESYKKLKVHVGPKSWDYKPLDEFSKKIIAYKKFVPKVGYNGAKADIESYIKDGSTLLYLELAGQEAMVKSITSVIMQGKVEMNNQKVLSDTLGFFGVFNAGNRRKMISLEDGIVHAILYHSPSISDTNFCVLIGRDQNELKDSFNTWLDKSQPMPFPKEYVSDIYEKLSQRKKLIELTTYNIEAVKIDLSVLEEECHDLQEIILEVCKEKGLISPDAKPMRVSAPLPKSNYLTVGQVQKVYDTLKSMPKTYELEDMDIKPVGLKLFGPNFTYYVVEADRGCEDDEFENEMTQCFGYIVNESDSSCSEWGYINVPEILSITTKHGFGFEQDLYFKDMYIDSKGNTYHKSELTFIINNCPKCKSDQIEVSETIDGFHHCSCIDCGNVFKQKINIKIDKKVA